VPLRRSVILAVVLSAALAAAGCGGSGSTATEAGPGGRVIGDTLTVYSSLPLRGPQAEAARAMVNGQRLALQDAGGTVGDFQVKFTSLDDSVGPEGWDRDATADNARRAAQDPTTIGYIGDADFGATAISIPVLNQSGIAQVSPAATYPGFTTTEDATEKGEPEKYYPSGARTFARVIPNDVVQGEAQARLQAADGCRRTFVVAGPEVPARALAEAVRNALGPAGIALAGEETADLTAGEADADLVAAIRETRADCVVLAASGGDDPVALLDALAAGLPGAGLYGPAVLARPELLARLAPRTQRALRLTRPVVGRRAEPPAALAVLARYRRVFGEPAPPEALFGYEAMALLLDTLRRAGDRADDRSFVSAELHRTRARRSVLGTYSIRPDGDTTLRRYAAWRVAAGAPVFERVVLR
jgi:branched-chain amino acid transport system substrate-binding protein